ncbi:MAG TPA: inorganic pyrophosphatase [Vicinamibacterales bacterium]|jgi:inorganic pyrophosphatase|nr:inorganic pyrophosphatase [Vicinamibacterales bacterium]
MPTRSRLRTPRRQPTIDSAAVNFFRPHPWHGLEVGPDPPEVLNAYIEITPFDLMKYEVDKVSGYLRVDRPQRSSSQHPTLYGFVPRTYCDERVRRLAPGARRGDGDPLDICVLSERAIARTEIIVRSRVIGGLQMIDGGDADDKIISVLDNDYVWGGVRDIRDAPSVLVERLQHYFLTYKLVPGQRATARIGKVYGRVHAFKVVRAAMADYADHFAREVHQPVNR